MKLYILLTNTGTVLTRVIGIFTQFPYNHVSFGFDKNLSCVYSFGRLKPRNPFVGGYVEENIRSGLYAIKKNTKCAILEMEINIDQKNKMEKILSEFSKERHLYFYNTLGLIKNAFGITEIKKSKAYFCSEFASKVFRESGVWDFEKPDIFVRPENFFQIKNVKKVYEGKLSDYGKK